MAAMKCLMVLLLFNFGLFCFGFNGDRIWNGTSASLKTYANVPRIILYGMLPFNETKGYPENHGGICTGSIISARHILTAAHCVGQRQNENNVTGEFQVRQIEYFIIDYEKLDTWFANKGGEIFLKEHGIVTTVKHHLGWHNFINEYKDDIAILEYPKGTNLNITPVLLAKNFVESDNEFAISVGYGDIDPDPNKAKFPRELMELKVPIIKECAWKNIDEKVICAGTKDARVDHGDSGAPLFITKNNKIYQIAVVHGGSYENGTAANYDSDFGIYNRISAYCDWIETTTNNEAKCVEIDGMPPAPPAPAPQQPLESTANPNNDPTAAALKKNNDNNGGMSYNILFPLLSLLLTFFIAF